MIVALKICVAVFGALFWIYGCLRYFLGLVRFVVVCDLGLLFRGLGRFWLVYVLFCWWVVLAVSLIVACGVCI